MKRSFVHAVTTTLALAASLAALPRLASACTVFELEGDEKVVAKEYDWSVGHGVVVANPAGAVKEALAWRSGGKPARWISKHASISFVQYGREFAAGGMNDAGLVVEKLMLAGSAFPEPDERPVVTTTQYAQYLLDTFASVQELLAGIGNVRVASSYVPVHFFVCDRSGACATLEFLEGALKVRAGKDLPIRALTNDPYAQSLAFLARHTGFGGSERLPEGTSSLARFVRATASIERVPRGGRAPVAAALSILDEVRIDPEPRRSVAYQWHIVYSPESRRVHFRTRAQPRLKWVDVGKLAASCGSPVRAVDVDEDAEGDVLERFREYTDEENEKLIHKNVPGGQLTAGTPLPAGAIERLAGYPRTVSCATPGTTTGVP